MHLLSSKNEFNVILYVLGTIQKSYNSILALREPFSLYHTILTFWFTFSPPFSRVRIHITTEFAHTFLTAAADPPPPLRVR